MRPNSWLLVLVLTGCTGTAPVLQDDTARVEVLGPTCGDR
jgi:hypothetical protein